MRRRRRLFNIKGDREFYETRLERRLLRSRESGEITGIVRLVWRGVLSLFCGEGVMVARRAEEAGMGYWAVMR